MARNLTSNRPRVSSCAGFTTLDNYMTHPPWSGPGIKDQKRIKRRWHPTPLKSPPLPRVSVKHIGLPWVGSLIPVSSRFRTKPPHRGGLIWLSAHVSVLWPVGRAWATLSSASVSKQKKDPSPPRRTASTGAAAEASKTWFGNTGSSFFLKAWITP